MKIPSIILILFLYSFICQSQNNHCSFAGELNDNYYRYLQSSFSNDIEIEKIINTISSEVGLEKNFIYVNSPGLNNCVALNYGGFRYILYDKSFLNTLSNYSTKKISVYVSVLSHEIGHHLQGHTLKNISEEDNKNSELEADKFSGFIMSKLGYSLFDAQEAIQKIPNTYSTTHPLKNKRLSAIKDGFNSAQLQFARNKDQIKNNLYVEYYNEALKFYNNGDYQNAIDNSTTAITLNKNNNFFPIVLRALSYSRLENYSSALNDFEKLESIKMEDKKVRSSYLYFNKGVALFSNKDYERASVEFLKAYELNANDKMALINYASCLSLAGNHLSAIKVFEVQLSDNDIYESELDNWTKGDVFLSKAISLYETNKNEEAKRYFDLAQSLFPEKYKNRAHPYYYKGKLFEDLKESDKAIANYLSFLKIYDEKQNYSYVDYNYSKANEVYYRLGRLYQENKQLQLSIQYLDKLINNGPELDLGYLIRGMSYYLMGNKIKANMDIQKACNLGSLEACEYLKTIDLENNEASKNSSIIEGGFRTEKILEYEYNLDTKEYDLVLEENIISELYFATNGIAFKRGNKKWKFANWTYKGFDEISKMHIYYDNYNQSVTFDESLTTISWYAKPENNVFQKIFVYQFLSKDESIIPTEGK